MSGNETEYSRVDGLVWTYCPVHAGMRLNEPADRFASIAPDAGAIIMDIREIVKRLYERKLVDDTCSTEPVGARMSTFGINCGSCNLGVLRGQVHNHLIQLVVNISIAIDIRNTTL